MAIQIGDKVPEFLGTDQDGKEVKMIDKSIDQTDSNSQYRL